MDEMCKGNASIGSRPLFQSTQLTWMNEIVEYQLELKSITNNFFNKFSYSIEKNDRSKSFRELYDFLLDLGIMIEVETLKCEDQ